MRELESFVEIAYSINEDKRIPAPMATEMLSGLLDGFLKHYKPDKFAVFEKKIRAERASLLKLNNRMKRELAPIACKAHVQLTDLNSIVMGVPNLGSSDIDFVFEVNSIAQQKQIAKELETIGYQFHKQYNENVPSRIKWLSYVKYVDYSSKKVEIEVKIRSARVMESINIAHRGIQSMPDKNKRLISWCKHKLEGTPYKKFKYILYGAAYSGHAKSIIFRLGVSQ